MSLPALALSLMLCLPTDDAMVAERGRVQWFEGSWNELLARARERDQVVFVDFWAEWCKPCKKMLAHTLTDERVVRELDGILCYSVDVDSAEGRPLTREFRVKTYPTLVFLDPDGAPRDRLMGYFAPEDFVRELARIKRNEGTLGALRAAVERNPKDIDVRFELALKLRAMGDVQGYEDQARAIRELDPQQVSLPARRLKLDAILTELRQSHELAPLYAFLEGEEHEEILFKGWYEVWKCEGMALHKTDEPAQQAKHRKGWARAARRVWKYVPAGKVASFGNYIAWSFYEQHEELTREDMEFALEVARRAAQEAPEDAAVIDTLACCLYVVGRREEALAQVLRCITLDPGNEEWKKRHRQFSRDR